MQIENLQIGQTVIDEIVRRIVQVSRPQKIILFGSAASGQFGPDSDIDVLVIQSGTDRRKIAGDIYMNLIGFKYPVDVVVVRPEDIDKYGDSNALVIAPAIREGKIIYEC